MSPKTWKYIEIVLLQGQEGGGQQSDITGPIIDYSRTYFELLGYRGIGRHRHDGIPHEPGLGLPNGLEALFLRILSVAQAVAEIVRILQVKSDPFDSQIPTP